MIVSLYLRHYKVYKGINYIPLSEGNSFSSLIGDNGAGKSSILEALDYCFNRKLSQEWPVNNEARYENAISDENTPYILPIFLIRKDKLKQTRGYKEYFKKAEELSKFLWNTNYGGKRLEEFYKHRSELRNVFNPEEYFLIAVGKKYNAAGIYFGPYHRGLDFLPVVKKNNSRDKDKEEKRRIEEEKELQSFFAGFYDYIISHYSYIHIPVETDVQTYTKLETQDMQKLMDKNIEKEIRKAIKPGTINQINDYLDSFVKEIEGVLVNYEYLGSKKNSLAMPDLVSKIIEAYFSVKVLNKKVAHVSKGMPVRELSSGEKRKALIDVAYAFLLKNNDRNNNIILAVDEPEASLNISNCYEQFEKLIKMSKNGHQILVSTHWYGFLPIVSQGSATALKKNLTNVISATFFDLYNYREYITHAKKKERGPLPLDYSIKSYNDLIQSIVISILQDKQEDRPYYWIICEGITEKIYFEYYLKNEIENNNLRILPVGGNTEVKKLYNYLLSPIKDPDYTKKGKILCLIDTDPTRFEVDYASNPNLLFERLVLKDKDSILVRVNDTLNYPPTEIEDCLNPVVFFNTLKEFSNEYESLKRIIDNNSLNENARYSATFLDLRDSEKKEIKDFFDGKEGFNKVRFAKRYTQMMQDSSFEKFQRLDWIEELKVKLFK